MGHTVPAGAEVSYLGTLFEDGGGSHQVVCTQELSVAVVGYRGSGSRWVLGCMGE